MNQDLTDAEKMQLTMDMMVEDFGWKFFQKDGKWHVAPKIGPGPNDHLSVPFSFDTQEEAIRFAGGAMFGACKDDPIMMLMFTAAAMKHTVRLREVKRRERELSESAAPAEPTTQAGSHAWLKGLVSKYGQQPQA